MTVAEARLIESGVEMLSVSDDIDFADRRLRNLNVRTVLGAFEALADTCLNEPNDTLDVLTEIALEVSGADSAGVTVEIAGGTDERAFHWIAIAGTLSAFLDCKLPRYPNPCSVCMERATAQHYTVGQRFFDELGVIAPVITDGIMLPWQTDHTRGTLWLISHSSDEAFDLGHVEAMRTFANFAAMAMRHREQQQVIQQQAEAAAAAAMAHHLAHAINNPLQSLTNTVFLMNMEKSTSAHTHQAEMDVARLSAIVHELVKPKRIH